MNAELPPEPGQIEQEPAPIHRHGYRWDISDWWCYDCETVTDYCKELNDFGQDSPKEPL